MNTRQRITLRVTLLLMIFIPLSLLVVSHYNSKHQEWIRHCHAIGGRVQVTRIVDTIVDGESDGGTSTHTKEGTETDCVDQGMRILDIEN